MTLTHLESALRELKNLFLEDAKRLITREYAAGLVGLDEGLTDRLLNALEGVGFVSTSGLGLYCLRCRADDGDAFVEA